MQTLNETQADYVRALMTGAGLIDHGNPLAYFTDYQVSPDEFWDATLRMVPDAETRAMLADNWVEAYNTYFTDRMFWDMTEGMEDWNE